MLSKYKGLSKDSEAGLGNKLWQRLRFGSQTEELGVIRGKLISYTSTIAVLLDTMHLRSSNRIEDKIDGVDNGIRRLERKIDDRFTDAVGNVDGSFARMRREIRIISSQAKSEQRNGSSLSLLSFSTYAGDNKEVWKEFRSELIKKGFNSQTLSKHRRVLQAYMLKLDQSGILDDYPLKREDQNKEIDWAPERKRLDEDLRLNSDSYVDLSTLSQKRNCFGDLIQDVEEDLFEQVKEQIAKNNFARDPKDRRDFLPFPTTSSGRRVEFGFPTPATAKGTILSRQLRSILRHPTPKFPEEPNPIRDGVTSRKRAGVGGIPYDRRWTRVSKSECGPEVLRILPLRCEIENNHVVILEHVSKKSIKKYSELSDTLRSNCPFSPGYRETANLDLAIRTIGNFESFAASCDFARARNVRFELYRFYREHYPSSPPISIAWLEEAKRECMHEIYEECEELAAKDTSSGFSAEQGPELARNRHNLCSLDCCTCKYWARLIHEVHTLIDSLVEEIELGHHPLASKFCDLFLVAAYAPENLSSDDRKLITFFVQRMRTEPKLSKLFEFDSSFKLAKFVA